MISDDYEWVICDEEECEEAIKNHAWGHIKALGWWFGKDGKTAYCPSHIPNWAIKWRERKR